MTYRIVVERDLENIPGYSWGKTTVHHDVLGILDEAMGALTPEQKAAVMKDFLTGREPNEESPKRELWFKTGEPFRELTEAEVQAELARRSTKEDFHP